MKLLTVMINDYFIPAGTKHPISAYLNPLFKPDEI